MFGYSSQQVDHIQMFSQLDHDLQLCHHGADLVRVGAGLGHLDGDRSACLAGGQSDRLRLHHAAERARADLTTCEPGQVRSGQARSSSGQG